MSPYDVHLENMQELSIVDNYMFGLSLTSLLKS